MILDKRDVIRHTVRMSLVSILKLKPFIAAAIMGAAGTFQAPEPPSFAALEAQLREFDANGQYDMAAKVASSYARVTSPDPMVYAAWMMALASGDRILEARAVFANGSRKFPELAKRYAPDVERAFALIQSGHIARTAASAAAAAGDYKLAARKLAEAYDVFPNNRMLGLQAAQFWAWVNEPVNAARIYRKLALSGDADLREEAAFFMVENRSELGRAANVANNAGWRILELGDTTEEALDRAQRYFDEADELIADYGTLGVSTMRSPYMGMAIIAADRGFEYSIPDLLKRGRDKGMIVLSGKVPKSAGKFASAMCNEYLRDNLVIVFDARIVARWAADVCADAKK